jgi:hypothetical protein
MTHMCWHQVITLRGLNVAGKAKVPEFTPFHNLAVLDSLAVFSANVARVPFTWEAYEPAKGRYNETYMDYIEDVVNVRPAYPKSGSFCGQELCGDVLRRG